MYNIYIMTTNTHQVHQGHIRLLRARHFGSNRSFPQALGRALVSLTGTEHHAESLSYGSSHESAGCARVCCGTCLAKFAMIQEATVKEASLTGYGARCSPQGAAVNKELRRHIQTTLFESRNPVTVRVSGLQRAPCSHLKNFPVPHLLLEKLAGC